MFKSHFFVYIYIVLFCYYCNNTVFNKRSFIPPRTIIVTRPHRNSARNNDYEFYLRRQLLL